MKKYLIRRPVRVFNRGMLVNSEFRQTTPVDEFYRQKVVTSSGDDAVRVTSDIYMLLNQDRLDRMTAENFQRYIERASAHDSVFSSLRSKLSDSDLFKFVKSRFIQSRSELLAWSHYLDYQQSKATEEAKAAIADAKAKADANKSGDTAGSGDIAGSGE